jgi:hypothetical protein
MKLKIQFATICLILCFITSTKVNEKEEQLFDMIQKDSEMTKTETKKLAEAGPISLFDSVNNEKEHEPYVPGINFNQVKETKIMEKNEMRTESKESLALTNSNNVTNENSNKNKNTNISKNTNTFNKSESQSKNNSEVKNLKKKIKSLMRMNERLMKKVKIDHISVGKKNQFKSGVLNFIEKYDSDINKLKANIDSSKTFVDKKIEQKESEIKTLYENATKDLENLHNEMMNANSEINNIKSEGKKAFNEIKVNPNFQELVVNNELSVEGISSLNKISAESINMNKLKIDSNGLTIKDPLFSINIGGERFNLKQITEEMATFKSLIEKCGPNFEKCMKPIQTMYSKISGNQKQMLTSFKKLQLETQDLLKEVRAKRLR